ncbi:MAG: TolC family protein, partial [Prochlorococcus sp.]
MRLTLARLLLLAGVLAQGATSVRAQQSLEVQPHSSSDSAATAEAGADKSALIDQSTLPNATEVKGSRPRVDPSVIEPAKTSLTKPLSSLASPASLALPTTTSEVKIKELRPLTLAEVEELAEVNSPSLKQAKSKVEQARLTLSAAYSAWYPTIGVSSGLSYKDQELHNASKENEYTEQYSYTQDWTTSFSATASWNLIDPKRVPQIAKARDTYEMERNTYLISLRELRLNAANAYFILQRQDEGVDVAQSGLRASLVSLRDAKARFKAGVATKLEVLEAETQLSQDQTQLTDYLGKQSIARRNLATLLDLPQNITPTAADPTKVVGLWQPSLEESIIAAYAFREELDRLILQISTNNSDANISLANIQPVIDLSNTFGSQRDEGINGTAASQTDWGNYTWNANNTVGIGLKWSIFDGGRAWADYRKNKQKAQGSEFQFASQRNAIRAEVEQSFYELKTSTQTLKSTGMGVLSAKESLRLSRLRFQAGVASQREVVDNQRDLTRNQQAYATSMFS